jgi:hypothetical protein
MSSEKLRNLKIALNNNEITDAQFEVVSNRYCFYNDSEWDFAIADNSVYVADHYRNEDKQY